MIGIGDGVRTISEAMAVRREEIVKSAIDSRIGNKDWFISDAVQRMSAKMTPAGSEIFLFDGDPLVEFFPFTFHESGEGGSSSIHVEQNYLLL